MKKVNRYLVFKYSSYYPDGGWSDLVNSFDDLNDAIICAKTIDDMDLFCDVDNFSNIVDLKKNEIIKRYRGFEKLNGVDGNGDLIPPEYGMQESDELI